MATHSSTLAWKIPRAEEPGIKKNEIIVICSNMDGPRHYHTK